MSSPFLQVDDLHVSYERGGRPLPVIDGLSIHAEPNQFVTLVGPSGCGKSTVIRAIGGLVDPDQGVVRIDGETVTGERGHISYMPQTPALLPWLSIAKNVVLAQQVTRGTRSSRAEVREWLAKVGIDGVADALPHTLSGGMQQRASFVRAMLSPGELVCLDEPFSALDALTRADAQKWLLDVWQRNRRTVLMITHSIEEALLLSDVVYVLRRRPTSVLERIEIDLPRPRTDELVESADFVALRRHITRLLDDERTAPEPGAA